MYAHYWGLVDSPFQSTIDTRWFYEGSSHEESLARLLFLVEQQRRCGVLVGEGGTGKSLLLSVLKRTAAQAYHDVIELDLTAKSADEMVWDLAAELRLNPLPEERTSTLWQRIDDALVGSQWARRQTVILMDQFEWADPSCQNVVARLLHQNTSTPSWVTLLAAVHLDRFNDCCGSFRHLIDLVIQVPPLSRDETRDYVITLAKKAGSRETLFTDAALDRLHEYSGGVPREINRLCDMSLLAAMSAGAKAVSEDMVTAVAQHGTLPNSPKNRLTSHDAIYKPSELSHA